MGSEEVYFKSYKERCPNTRDEKHVLEYQGKENTYWCKMCGRLLQWQEDEEGYWRLRKAYSKD